MGKLSLLFLSVLVTVALCSSGLTAAPQDKDGSIDPTTAASDAKVLREIENQSDAMANQLEQEDEGDVRIEFLQEFEREIMAMTEKLQNEEVRANVQDYVIGMDIQNPDEGDDKDVARRKKRGLGKWLRRVANALRGFANFLEALAIGLDALAAMGRKR